MTLNNLSKPTVIATLLLTAGLGLSALGQSPTAQTETEPALPATSASATSAPGQPLQPLQTRSNEGFWGHVNPFARKKWVNRQLDPVKDRLNELDELQAKNASDIRSVDARAQAGIRQAQSTADQADQTATAANNTATQASQTAMQANSRTNQLNSTVSSLDQYQKVNDTEIRFRPGQTVLNARAKDALGQIAAQLQGHKGYVIEVAGYSRTRGQAGIQSSQRMADAVVRYLAEQEIPVYRIHQVAMGSASVGDQESTAYGSIVRVTLMQNSLAALNSPSSDGSSPIGATQRSSALPSPQGAASQPTAHNNN